MENPHYSPNKLVLNENKKQYEILDINGPEDIWENVKSDSRIRDIEDIMYDLNKEEITEIQSEMIKELKDFKEKEFQQMKQNYNLQDEEVKVMLFKEDQLYIENPTHFQPEMTTQDHPNIFSPYENSDENLKSNKIKKLILLMDEEVYDEEEEEKRILVDKKQEKQPGINNLIASDIDKPNEKSKILDRSEDDTKFHKLDSQGHIRVDQENSKHIGNYKSKRLIEKIKKESKDRIHLKDKKIILNLEELQKQHINTDKFILEGDLNQNDQAQMDRVHKDLKLMHPYKLEDGKIQPLPCCSSTGWYCCGNKNSQSDLEKLGIGMVCYFKVLKVFIVCFLIISLLNLPIYYIYYNNQNQKKVANYRDALFKLTIGNIASSLYNCDIFPINFIQLRSKQTQRFNLDCYDLNITSIVGFGTSMDSQKEVDNISNCANFTSSKSLWLDPFCDLTTYARNSSLSCINTKQCSFDIDLSYVRNNCKFLPNSTFNFYMKYECHDDWIQLGIKDIYMTRTSFGFLVVGIDIGSMTVLLICLFIITTSQRRNELQFKEKYILISDYTLHIKNIPMPAKNIYRELNQLVAHLKNALQMEELINPGKESVLKLTSNIMYQDLYSDFTNTVNTKNIQKTFLYDINYPLFTTNKLEDIMNYNNIKQDKLNSEKKIQFDDNKYKYVKKLDELKSKMKKIKQKIKNRDELHYIDEAYLTFRNQKIAHFFYEAYKKNKSVRCCYIICCQYKKIKHLYYRGNWLDITFSKDEPSNINWQNLTYSPWKRCLRSTLSVFIAVLVLIISFVVIISVKYSQNILSEKYNNHIDCSYIDSTLPLVLEEFALNSESSNDKIHTHCYCMNYLVTHSYIETETFTPPGTIIQPCSNWLIAYLQYNSIFTLISVIIPIVGSLLILVMKWLSKFEKTKTLTEELTSSMWKMFILQFINTGLVIVLVNIYIQPVKEWWKNFPMFTGNYDDLNPSWYANVGVTIVFTMFINVIVPHISALLEMLFVFVYRCCDSGCTKGRKTKKSNKREFFELYMGPQFAIDIRYSEILTTIFVSLIYSSGMPAMYLSILLYLFLTYWIDKYLVLRFYRLPPKYDLYLANVFNLFIFVALVLHFCFGIWIYGNPSFFENNSNSFLSFFSNNIQKLIQSDDSFVKEIVKRLTLSHNILCLFYLALLVLIIIFRLTVFPFVYLFLNRNKLSEYIEKKNMEIGLAIPMKSLLKSYELRKIQMIKMMKIIGSAKKKTVENGTRGNLTSVSQLKNYFQMGINYDREFLEYKLKKIAKNDFKNLDKDFDEEIKTLIEKYDLEEKEIISGDVSYNIAYIPEFETVAYYEYIKNIIS